MSWTSGCALQQNSALVVKGCNLPSDQSKTLTGKWKTTPIPVAFHQGDFNSQEMQLVVAAAGTWNQFFSASLNLQPIDIGSSDSPHLSAQAKPATICSSNILNGTSYMGAAVIYKDGTWPYTSMPDAIALTTTCPMPISPTPPANQPSQSFYQAVIEVNYQSFFVNGNRVPDLQTILTHELGHLVGLAHSCETADKTGVPNCNDSNINSAYTDAVMAPLFGFDSNGQGEQKRQLTANDEGRANCLYTTSGS